MKSALLRLRLPTGIVLAVLVLVACPQRWSVATAGAVIPIGVATNPNLSNSSDKPASRDEKSTPASQFLTAYNSMSLADWLQEKGMRAEATDLYTEALNLFLKISADYPQWQPDVVSFRINYCRSALQTPSKRVAQASRPSESAIRNQQSEIRNQVVATSNATALSPLNFKLQQAAFKERGRDYTSALAMYSALLEEYPLEPWSLKGACRCCLRLGHIDQARALTQQALTLPLPDADLNLLAALVDCHDGRYQAAIPLLYRSLKQNSACPEAHVALGVALTAIGEIKEAQEEMKRAISLNPKLGDAYYNLARLSLLQKPTDNAAHVNHQFDIDTARVHYQNALRHGAAPDPELDTLLAE